MEDINADLAPTVLTIFGATGDLSLNYLLPALNTLAVGKLLPEHFRLVAVGRRPMNDEEFKSFVAKAFKEKGRKPLHKDFLSRIFYFKADFDNPESFKTLPKALADHAADNPDVCFNRLYYFATLPNYFEPLSNTLKKAGLLVGCTEHGRTIRVLIEKPFGFNLATARSLNKSLLTYFKEKQIYRIDHYLGKETVQNLLIMRFANSFLEPLWNAKYVDHVEVSALYDDGLDTRANFYEKTGAMRDVLQNHILQMLALIAMERPKNLDTESIRDAKVHVMKHLKPFTKQTVKQGVVRGQYGSSGKIKGYADAVGKQTETETFVALKTFITTPRWKGVPFYIRTGVRLARKVTEISIHFKKSKDGPFDSGSVNENVFSFRIQPDESVSMQMNNKIPGFGLKLHKAFLDFGYKQFNLEIPGAYERLLRDFMQGDQRLFIRSDEIEAAWKFVDTIRNNWESLPLHMYLPMSEGPEAAESLIEKDGHQWWTR